MILRRVLKNILFLSAGTLLLLPIPALCQDEPGQAEEPPDTMEEVIVYGSKSLIDLKLEMYQAEEVLFDLFNSFNTNDDFDVHCYREAPIGSHIKQRVCKSNLYRKMLRRASQKMMQGEQYVYPVAEIKQINERLLKEMTETALKQPEMLEALTRATQAKEALESERKRRCEGKFLFCW